MSICIFHNGNRKILDFYKKKFKNLTFLGNLSEATNLNNPDGFWEICFADATRENLAQAVLAGVHIIRHISEYHDDCKNLLPECEKFSYSDWLNFVVAKNISFADEIISDIVIDCGINKETAIITTGRTANSHFREVLLELNVNSFECEKILYPRLFLAESAILMWREDQWECLTSMWIGLNTKFIHNTNNQPPLNFTIEKIDLDWIRSDWANMSHSVLDHAVFFASVLKRPTTIMTTEKSILDYTSIHKKVNYKKSNIIAQYDETKQFYQNSEVEKILNLLYTRIQRKLPVWTKP